MDGGCSSASTMANGSSDAALEENKVPCLALLVTVEKYVGKKETISSSRIRLDLLVNIGAMLGTGKGK